MAKNKDSEFGVGLPIEDRVGEPGERVRAPVVAGECSQVGKLVEEPCDTPELVREAAGDTCTSFTPVEAERVRKILIRARVNRYLHLSSARRRASA
jgi:hypothetical protein